MNGAQFLNATSFATLRPIIVISPLTKMQASLLSQRLDLNTFVLYDFVSCTKIRIWLIIENVTFYFCKYTIICCIQQIQFSLKFYCLCYSFTFNGSKEKFRIVFCYFSVIKNIVAPLSSSNFSVKSICRGIVKFVRLDKSMLMSL